MTPRVLLLDLGNVVFPLYFNEIFQWLGMKGERPSPVFLSAFDEVYLPYDRGEIGSGEFVSGLRDRLGLDFEDEEFQRIWVSCWREDMPGINELLDEAPEDLCLAVLSNTNPMHMDNFLETRPVLKKFHRLFLSYEMGLSKPEKEIYLRVLDELKVSPGEVVFFDDKPENVEGALSAGMQAHVFRDADQIRDILGMPKSGVLKAR